AAFRSRRLRKMISNSALNSNEPLEESTATSSSVTLSGARRAKVTPRFLDIEQHIINSRNSDRIRPRRPLRKWHDPIGPQHVRSLWTRIPSGLTSDYCAKPLRRDTRAQAGRQCVIQSARG